MLHAPLLLPLLGAYHPSAARLHNHHQTVLTSAWRRTAASVRLDGGVGLETAASLGEGDVIDQLVYGGIPNVAVLVSDASAAHRFYTEVLGMTDEPSSDLDAPGACVRVGAQTIQLLELPNPDPIAVDPEYSMSAPPRGYVAKGRPVHAGRDRHVAITLHDLAPLKASLEAIDHPYTMSYSGRQALFTRDNDGNGWEFGPPVTYAKATRLFPPYLEAQPPPAVTDAPIGWGGIPHVGLLVADTPRAKAFYCDVLGMKDETDLRPVKLPFAGLFLRCGEQQVHILQLPNPDPNTADARPAYGQDRRTTYSVRALEPVRAALDSERCRHLFGEKWPYTCAADAAGRAVLYCKDPDANELVFVEDPSIVPIAETADGPMVPWTRLW